MTLLTIALLVTSDVRKDVQQEIADALKHEGAIVLEVTQSQFQSNCPPEDRAHEPQRVAKVHSANAHMLKMANTVLYVRADTYSSEDYLIRAAVAEDLPVIDATVLEFRGTPTRDILESIREAVLSRDRPSFEALLLGTWAGPAGKPL